MELVRIDGAEGEGGGQVLRTSLTMSLLMNKPFEITRIRANRENPGLAAQHLQSVKAAADISGSAIEGAQIGSTELRFTPGPTARGSYHFDVGTAGSTSLVFQSICFPLALRAPGSSVAIRGGTHVQRSPSIDYLTNQWLPWMKRLGYEFQVEMKRTGFYPKGGGEIEANIGMRHQAPALDLTRRGEPVEIRVASLYGSLPRHVGERQAQAAEALLKTRALPFSSVVEETSAYSPGSQASVLGRFENGSAMYTSLGERGRPAEAVGKDAAARFLVFYDSGAAIDEYLADQLLIPAVLNRNPVKYTTCCITQHLLTNCDVIRKFCLADIRIHGTPGEQGVVEVDASRVQPEQ